MAETVGALGGLGRRKWAVSFEFHDPLHPAYL
jgi:hypothetical protein